MSQVYESRPWLKLPVSSKSAIHDTVTTSHEEPVPSNKQQPPQQARSRSATISGRFLTTTLPKRLSKPSHLHAADAVIFQLKPIKEGYLIHKRKKRWIILDDANLYIFKGTEDYNQPTIIPLQCCKARSLGKEVSGFDIITSIHTYQFFEDKDSTNYKDWIPQIETVCNNLVMDSIGGKKEKNILTKTYSKLILEEDIGSAQAIAIEVAMREDNRTCADCRAPAPEWASTNLGIFICIDCSGIHRSFGTHISKVRSVKLDKWDKESTLLIDSIGNRKANQYWEHYIPPSFSPISPTSKLHDRKIWLQFKYIKKRFTPDWKDSEGDEDVGFDSSTGTILNKNHKKLLELKNAANELRFRDFKSTFVQLLQEDEDFKDEMRVLLFSDIDLSSLKPFIIPSTSDLSPDSTPSPFPNATRLSSLPPSLSDSPSPQPRDASSPVSRLTLPAVTANYPPPLSPNVNQAVSPKTNFPPPVITPATAKSRTSLPPLSISKSPNHALKSNSNPSPTFPPPVIAVNDPKSPRLSAHTPVFTPLLSPRKTGFPPPILISPRSSDSPKTPSFPPPLLSPNKSLTPSFPPPVIPISPKSAPLPSLKSNTPTGSPRTSFPPPVFPINGSISPRPSAPNFPPPIIAPAPAHSPRQIPSIIIVDADKDGKENEANDNALDQSQLNNCTKDTNIH